MISILNDNNLVSSNIPFFQIFLLLLIILLILIVKRFRMSIKHENRIKDFSIAPDEDILIINHYRMNYVKFINYLSFYFRNSVFLNKYAKYYEPYVGIVNNYYKSGLEFIISEIVFSILTLLSIDILLILNGYILTPFGFVMTILLSYGFIAFNHYKKFNNYRKEIKKSFYEFMTILLALLKDNSFIQSLDLVINKTKGSVNKELNKMKRDLEYGLSIHDAFVRCYERTKIREFNIIAEYIYVIPNIGGNTSDSFDLSYTTLLEKSKMERKVFNKTLGMYMFLVLLSLIPLFVFLNYLVFNYEYFFYITSTIMGRLIIFAIIILYLVYILSIRFIVRGSVRL